MRSDPVSLRVLIAEDHDLVSQGLEEMLSDLDKVEVVGVADSGDQAVAQSQQNVDVVLMDVNFSRGSMSGIEAIRRIKELSLDTKVLILTMFTDPGTVAEAIKAGADGYMSKAATRDQVVQAIFDAAKGRAVLDPNVTDGLFGRISGKDPRALSDRELTVLQLLSSGKSIREVADHLNVPEETVKALLKQIFRKLHIRDRTPWRFDFFDPREEMVRMMLLLVFLGAVVAVLLWRSAFIGS